MLTHSSDWIFNPMRYIGYALLASIAIQAWNTSYSFSIFVVLFHCCSNCDLLYCTHCFLINSIITIIIIMTILGLAESFKTMNRLGLIATLFDSLFFKNYKRWRREISTQPSFKSLIYAIKIWNRNLIQFKYYWLFRNVNIWSFSAVFSS